MNAATLHAAEQEAKEFLRAVSRVKELASKTELPVMGSKETGALRRQSMNLTRALAELRKPS